MIRNLTSILVILFSSTIFYAQDILIDWGDEWTYYDKGNEPSKQPGNTFWYEQNFITDTLIWDKGPAQLGYGDGDEATVTQNSITQYFRKEFIITDASVYEDFDLDILYDDGAVIYLNGNILKKVNMPNGNIGYNTLAINTINNNALESSNFTAGLLDSINVIAVEMHQQKLTSSDISFDLKLQLNIAGYTKIVRGPYLQKASANAITVKWRTAKPTESIVHYGTNLDSLDQTTNELSLKTDHEITLSGLNPNTLYYYEIANNNFVLKPDSSNLYFKTPPLTGTQQHVTAWILGDCGTQNDDQRAVRDAYYNYIGNKHTDMMLFLGDNAYSDGKDEEYQYALFENMYEDKLQNTIAWSTRGNHERVDASTQTIPYYDIFTFPTNGECGGLASGTEAYYSFDYANIHFIVLDSYDTSRDVGSAMYTWCEADIQNTTAEWIVALWHHPPYTKGSHNSDFETELVQMRQNFLPMLEANGIDLVLSGHSHSYERSYFLNGHYGKSNTFDINENTIGDNGATSGRLEDNVPYEKYILGPEAGEGTVYITAGSSGKATGGALNHQAMYLSVNELGSCVLEVNQDTMQVKFLKETGEIVDYFTITKGVCNYNGSCDDGDPCTVGDFLDSACNCVGVFTDSDNDTVCDAFDKCPNFNDLIDADNDGVCDSADQCPGFDDAIDVDNDGIPDGCDPCIAGTTCSDMNACTINDVLDNNCTCIGVFQDADNDTVCDANDECPGYDDRIDVDNDNIIDGCDPCITGSVCTDNDVCTASDKYDADCNCVGTYLDSDNDGVCNYNDCEPFNSNNFELDACGICSSGNDGTLNFPSNSLNHSGVGFGSIFTSFDAMYNNVQFSISGINSQLFGNADNRYSEKIAIYYHNNQGAVLFHNFADNQNTVTVSFNFAVSGITLRLYDGENNHSGTSVMSVNLSEVSGCFATCKEVLNIKNDIPVNIYQAEQTIVSDGAVQSQGFVNFKAGDLIQLNNNFSVDTKADFSAQIEDCE